VPFAECNRGFAECPRQKALGKAPEAGSVKHDIGQLKQIVTELKMEIVALRTKSPKPFVIVDSACVLSLVIGCMFGIVVAMYLD
jgi:cyanate permease